MSRPGAHGLRPEPAQPQAAVGLHDVGDRPRPDDGDDQDQTPSPAQAARPGRSAIPYPQRQTGQARHDQSAAALDENRDRQSKPKQSPSPKTGLGLALRGGVDLGQGRQGQGDRAAKHRVRRGDPGFAGEKQTHREHEAGDQTGRRAEKGAGAPDAGRRRQGAAQQRGYTIGPDFARLDR